MRVVPQYYFDFRDGDRETRDNEGVLLAGLDEARKEAIRALDQRSRGKIPDGNRRDSRLAIREENGPVLMVVSLSLRVERK